MNAPINGLRPGHGQHWSIAEAADRLGISATSLAQLVSSGELKTVSHGPLGARIHDSEILRYQSRQHRRPPESAAPRVPGLSEPESVILVALWTAAGPLTVAELTKCVNVSPGTAARILDRLLAAGLVRRTRRDQPRRAYCYRPAQSPDEYAATLARQVHDAVSQGRTTLAVAEESG